MTDHDAPDQNGEPEFASHLHEESSATPETSATSPAALQDMQLSLVDRIADVDDERRRSSTQLRKALQAHKDAVEQRLVGYRHALIGLSALTGLLTAGMLGLGWTLYSQRTDVAQQIAGIATAAPSADEMSSRATEELATQIADIDVRLARLAAQLGDVEPTALSDAMEALSGQVEAVRADVQSLSEDPSGIDAAEPMDAGIDVTGAAPAPAGAPPASAVKTAAVDRERSTPSQPPTAASEQASGGGGLEIEDLAEVDTTEIKIEQSQLEAQIAATRDAYVDRTQSGSLEVDRLIDDQLERLEREYQRLARQVDSPAIQPARTQSLASAGVAGSDPSTLSADAVASDAGDGSDGDASSGVESPGMTTQQAWIALQLIGFRSRDEVSAFIAEHSLPEPLYLRSETYRGKPWYALIRSLHENMESAAAARDALPQDLARLDIWLRELPAGTDLERIEPSADN